MKQHQPLPQTKADLPRPEILNQIQAMDIPYDPVIRAFASATGVSNGVAVLSVSSVLGSIAGPEASIVGLMGEPIHPGFNLLMAGADHGPWLRCQQSLLRTVESLQTQWRSLCQGVPHADLATVENLPGRNRIFDMNKHFNDIDLLNQARTLPYVQTGRALRRPSVMLLSPKPEVFKQAVSEILDRHVSIFYPHGLLFDECSKLFPSRQWQELLARLADATAGHDECLPPPSKAVGFGQLATLKAFLFMTSTQSQVSAAMSSNNPDVVRLLNQSLVVRPSFGKPENLDGIDRRLLEHGHSLWLNAATRVLSAQRSASGLQFRPNSKGYELLAEYDAYLRTTLDTSLWPRESWVFELPWKLTWSLWVIGGGRPEFCAAAGIHFAHQALSEHHAFRKAELERTRLETHELARTAMLSKIAQLGHGTIRELLRKYSKQNKALHMELLEELIREGKVTRQGNNINLAAFSEQENNLTIAADAQSP